jgi:hypothetical protein
MDRLNEDADLIFSSEEDFVTWDDKGHNVNDGASSSSARHETIGMVVLNNECPFFGGSGSKRGKDSTRQMCHFPVGTALSLDCRTGHNGPVTTNGNMGIQYVSYHPSESAADVKSRSVLQLPHHWENGTFTISPLAPSLSLFFLVL